jgi:hypothetical protein
MRTPSSRIDRAPGAPARRTPWTSSLSAPNLRGAISGLLRKRLGLNVVLTLNAAGERVYRIG